MPALEPAFPAMSPNENLHREPSNTVPTSPALSSASTHSSMPGLEPAFPASSPNENCEPSNSRFGPTSPGLHVHLQTWLSTHFPPPPYSSTTEPMASGFWTLALPNGGYLEIHYVPPQPSSPST
ncbi:hypothetical protein DFP72DRAFT_1172565 [Ephemerocybe angulata]|uniref:Uncharacterized protein n=1 Tax=Ephemerocybe angulata TaxID=980116 RepID=A0A8H6HSS1_9AGAR|nr:hypothetical protein DFP72DRAFT_1172565 [Tulosesus angulatus]